MRELVSFVRAMLCEVPTNRRSIAGFAVPILLLVLVIFGATAFSSAPSAPVRLPIEILGPDGYTESATVSVTDATDINRLWIQGNSMGFNYSTSTKASIRVNGGSWIPLNNSRVTCEYPERNYGCVDSGLGTIRFSVPVTGVTEGPNVIDFRFNGTDGQSVGWRVIDFNLLRTDGTKVLPTSAFVHDDPTSWQPPRPSSSDVAQGKVLWETAGLVDSPLSTAKAIRAKCADCHAKSGRDLKYFSFSNKSIVARSVFHGLSEVDGQKIASYIRTLDVEPYGKPWDPPYQPGPGLDTKPAEAWAAGAGLEWVLDKDSEMIPYVFPTSDRASVADTKSTLNMREIPIAFQLPDWNRWLPRVHPIDGLGTGFVASKPYQDFETAIPAAMAGYPDLKSIQQTKIGNVMELVFGGSRDWGRDWSEVTNRDRSDAELGFRQWRLVKMWEIVQEYGIEDITDEIYPPDSRGVEHGEKRGWPGITSSAFSLAPHRIAGNNFPGPYRSEDVNLYFSTAWYQLQVILNPGFREGTEQKPLDWKYHMPHIRDVDQRTGHDQTMRKMASLIKLYQMIDTPYGASYGRGWQWRIGNPSQVWYDEAGDGSNPGALTKTEYKDVVEPIIESWITKTEQFGPDDWCRELGDLCLTPSNFVPQPYTGTGYFLRGHENATQAYRLLPALDELGVSVSVLERLADWFERAWPNANWHQLYSGGTSSNSAPIINLTAPVASSAFAINTTITIKANATDADGSVSQVEFYVGSEKIGTDSAAPFEQAWTPTSTGNFALTARATDNNGAASTSGARSVTITEAPLPPATQSISLQQGWNLVSSFVQPGENDMPSIFSGIKSDILLVKNQSGGQYHPPSGLNTIGNWDPAEAYEVYSTASQSLQIEGTEIASSTAVSLAAGWNHLAYIRDSSAPIGTALSAILGKVNIVKDAGGRVFYPAYSINEIGSMQPGQGYKIHLSDNALLTYPSGSGKFEGFAGNPGPARASSGLLVVEGADLLDGTTVSVMTESGTPVGEGIIAAGKALVHLSGDDTFTSLDREGATEGERLQISLVQPAGEAVEDVSIESIHDALTNRIVSDGILTYRNDAVVIAKVATISESLQLEQNFPNPFSTSTSIRYSLPRPSHVVVDVYNVAGQKVARLLDEDRAAGWHTVEFDSRGFASGVYFYRLITDESIVHKEMLLRK